MVEECVNIYEYERLLMGLQSKYVTSFDAPRGSESNKKEFGNIWRYAITHILKWTPEEACKYLTEDIVKKLKLNSTYFALDYDYRKNPVSGYKSLLQYAFPNEIKYNLQIETIDEYKKVAKLDEWADDKQKYKFKKNFFTDNNGLNRAKIVLNYVIDTYYNYFSIEELYAYFSKDENCKKCVKKFNLINPTLILYKNKFFDYFNSAYNKRNDFYYWSYKFNKEIENSKKLNNKDPNGE